MRINRFFITASLSLLLFCLLPQASFAAGIQDASIAPMLEQALPAVVNIKAQIKVTDFVTLQQLQKQQQSPNDTTPPGKIRDTFVSVGSGVIVNADKGFILTNAHVVNDAQTVTVTLSDGRHFRAKTIGLDKPSDIALLQIKAKGLKAIQFGNSNNLKVGDFVAAIGNPFGLNQTVTSGIVSALGRSNLGIESFENFIQTDTPINPGNSGGALIDMKGSLVGINTAILAPERGSIGIGFAIPADMAKSVMMQLLEYGDVKRGMLGVAAQDLTPDLASAFGMEATSGAAITMVLPDSPAQKAGIQVGDIITSINNIKVKTASDVVNAIGFLRVNSKASINLLRAGKTISANISLTDPKARKQSIEKSDPFLFGVSLKNFSLISPIHGNIQGVLIVSVEEASNAWNSDLRPGDVVTSINQQHIKNIEELKAHVSKASKTILLNVLRGPSAIFLVISKEP